MTCSAGWLSGCPQEQATSSRSRWGESSPHAWRWSGRNGLGAAEWRHDYRALQPDVPTWFIEDRTDLTDRLTEIRA